MVRKFCLYLSFLLLFSGSQTKVLSSIENFEDEKIIGVEYLNKIPENDYILGPGDNLFVIVSREIPELTSLINIDGEGTIYLPKLNRIYVEGLTINELKSTLNKAYQKFVKRPSVEVVVTKYRPIRVLVDGEVENPGVQIMTGAYSLTKSVKDNIDVVE